MIFNFIDLDNMAGGDRSSKESNSSKQSINDDPDDGLDFEQQFANYKIKMMRSKKYLEKIHLQMTQYNIENQKINQVDQLIQKPISLITGLSNLISG